MEITQPLNFFLALTLLSGAFDSMRAGSANDQAPKPDKSRYTLFNPTPTALMRDFNTDRPDQTEGPFTVDAGHFQIEFGTLTYSRDRYNSDKERVDRFDFAQVNLRVGLLNNTEFDLIISPYSYVRTKDKMTRQRQLQKGFGDLTLRMKINIWGNEEGPFAFGLIPFLNVPTADDGLGASGEEGGVHLPVQVSLPGNWDLGAETLFAAQRGQSDLHWGFDNSITLGHEIVKKLSGYIEFYSQVSTEAHQGWVGTVDTGLVYDIYDNFKIDGGVNVGVTKAATDLQPFFGASWRF